MNLGREPEALADFEKGAELEASDLTGFYQVGKSLERIQGARRLTLEKYRAKARVALLVKQNEAKQRRYELTRMNEAEVRGAKPIGKEVPAGTPSKAAPAANPPGAVDPFGGPAPATKGADADPFAAPGTPAEKPATPMDDPFGAPAAKPAEPAAPAPADPFGGPAVEPAKPVDPVAPPAVEPAAPAPADPFVRPIQRCQSQLNLPHLLLNPLLLQLILQSQPNLLLRLTHLVHLQ